MAIEKMKLVMVNGPTAQLNKMIGALCADGIFQPEPAGSFISPSMGYASLSEENPYLATISAIKEIAQQFNMDLSETKGAKGIVIDEKVEAYVE